MTILPLLPIWGSNLSSTITLSKLIYSYLVLVYKNSAKLPVEDAYGKLYYLCFQGWPKVGVNMNPIAWVPVTACLDTAT